MTTREKRCRPTLAERFNRQHIKGAPGECWKWIGVKARGYGRISVGGRPTGAHRVAWELAHGKIPSGLFACHKCDVRDCVNPDHLFLGTAKDNSQDCLAKGRLTHLVGERASRAKLSDEQVRSIRALLSAGGVQRSIAASYGVSESVVSRIKHGVNWGEVR